MKYNRLMKLPTKTRNKLPDSKFGLPSKRAYPLENASHAANAKSRASEMEHKGRISASTKASIDRKADSVLGHKSVKNAGSHKGKMDCC